MPDYRLFSGGCSAIWGTKSISLLSGAGGWWCQRTHQGWGDDRAAAAKRVKFLECNSGSLSHSRRGMPHLLLKAAQQNLPTVPLQKGYGFVHSIRYAPFKASQAPSCANLWETHPRERVSSIFSLTLSTAQAQLSMSHLASSRET